MEKLKPCPFCGGEAVVYKFHRPGFHMECEEYCGYVYCNECDMTISRQYGESYEDAATKAIKVWNTRVERTCHNLGREEGTNYELYDFGCSSCGYCADITEPNYCPHCRAKVVD